MLVDIPREEVVVNLWLSQAPDLFVVDAYGRQAHSFQYFVSLPDIGWFYRRTQGIVEPARPLILLRGSEVRYEGELVVREVVPFFDFDQDPRSGGWGPVVATAPVRQDGNRLTFRFPLSVFYEDQGRSPFGSGSSFALHYFLELYEFGATRGRYVQAAATVALVDAPIEVMAQQPSKPPAQSKRPRFTVVHVLDRRSTEEMPEPFVAANVDAGTVELGPGRARPLSHQLADINGDGAEDLVLTFHTPDLELSCIDDDVHLLGEIVDLHSRRLFVGRDALRPPPCR